MPLTSPHITAPPRLGSTMLVTTFLLVSSASAFIQHRPPIRIQSLKATETFQRSLLDARLNPSSTKAQNSVETSPEPVTKRGPSVDYDAAARLAYEAAGSTVNFEEYKVKYLDETSALMAEKNPYVKNVSTKAVTSKPAETQLENNRGPSVDYDAAAKLAYDAAGKPGIFAEFNAKYLEETSTIIAKKNPYKVIEEPEAVTSPMEEDKPIASFPPPAPPAMTSPPATAAKVQLQKTSFTVPRELALVPINEASVQFTAGLLGASAGFLLGGPVLSAILAATTNYLSRKDDVGTKDTSPKKIVDTASQTVLLLYNYLARFEKENKVVDSTFKVLEGAVDKVKGSDSGIGSTLVTVESTLGSVAKKVEELNDDYDFVNGAGTVLNSVGDLVEISADKVVELNEEYKLTERVGGVIKGTVEKLTDDKK